MPLSHQPHGIPEAALGEFSCPHLVYSCHGFCSLLVSLLGAQGWETEESKKDSQLNVYSKQKMVEVSGFCVTMSESHIVYNNNC